MPDFSALIERLRSGVRTYIKSILHETLAGMSAAVRTRDREDQSRSAGLGQTRGA